MLKPVFHDCCYRKLAIQFRRQTRLAVLHQISQNRLPDSLVLILVNDHASYFFGDDILALSCCHISLSEMLLSTDLEYFIVP